MNILWIKRLSAKTKYKQLINSPRPLKARHIVAKTTLNCPKVFDFLASFISSQQNAGYSTLFCYNSAAQTRKMRAQATRGLF
jgi:hypothetical protein